MRLGVHQGPQQVVQAGVEVLENNRQFPLREGEGGGCQLHFNYKHFISDTRVLKRHTMSFIYSMLAYELQHRILNTSFMNALQSVSKI